MAETLLTDDKRQRFVLLVDQFEELFTQTRNEEEQSAFINLLTTAAQVADGRTIIAISLRSDFVSNCALYPELRNLLSQEFQLVGAMEPRDLARAITLPSLEVGAEIEPVLVKQIMDDMKGEPGALPLMSFALLDLFEEEKTAEGEAMDLTLEEYLQRGGIDSALERHANDVFADFSDEQKTLARGIFAKLITVGEGRLDTRRTAAFEELVPAGTSRELVAATVAALAEEDARLITTSVARDERLTDQAVADTATVTIAHEKLIDAWPWLRRLVDENREGIKLQNDIAEATQEWEEHNRDNSYLYSGVRLENVEEQLEAGDLQLAESSSDFIQASIARRKANARNRRLVMAGLVVLALIAGAAALLASDSAGRARDSEARAQDNLVTATIAQGQAESEKQRAEAQTTRALAAEQDAIDAQGTAVAERADAVAANATAEAEATRAFISQELAEENADRAAYQAKLTESQALAVAADAESQVDPILAAQLAVAAHQVAGTGPAYAAVQRHVPGSARPAHTLAHDDPVNGAAWNEDESLILTWGGNYADRRGTASVWEAGSETPRETLAHDDRVRGAAWNEDGSLILTWSDDGTASVWEASTGREAAMLEGDGSAVNSAAWNDDESQIMMTTRDGHAIIYMMDQERLLKTACGRIPHNLKWDDWRRYFPDQDYLCICDDLPPHPSVLQAPAAEIDEVSCPLAETVSEQ